MTSAQVDVLAPLASPLPPPPEGEVLTQSQWTTLMAIADTIIPSLEVSSASSSTTHFRIEASEYTVAVEKLKEAIPGDAEADLPRLYLNENASSVPGYKELVHRTLGEYVREDGRKGIALILTALEYVLVSGISCFHHY